MPTSYKDHDDFCPYHVNWDSEDCRCGASGERDPHLGMLETKPGMWEPMALRPRKNPLPPWGRDATSAGHQDIFEVTRQVDREADLYRPRAHEHAFNCDWHVDQYDWECTCGAVLDPAAKRPAWIRMPHRTLPQRFRAAVRAFLA